MAEGGIRLIGFSAAEIETVRSSLPAPFDSWTLIIDQPDNVDLQTIIGLFRVGRGDLPAENKRAVDALAAIGYPVVIIGDEFSAQANFAWLNLGAQRYLSVDLLSWHLGDCLNALIPNTERVKKADISALPDRLVRFQQVEKYLAHSGNSHLSLPDPVEDVVFFFNQDSVLEYVSDSFAAYFDLPAKKLVGLSLDQASALLSEPFLAPNLRKALATHQMAYSEIEVPFPAGTRWLGNRMVPINDDNGQYCGILTISRDITERVKAEQDLRAVRAQLESLLRVSPIVIYSADATFPHKMRYISENVKTVLGYEPGLYLSDEKFIQNKLHPKDVEGYFQGMKQISETGEASFTYRFLHADNRYCCIHEVAKLQRSANGEADQIFGYFSDETEQREQAEALRRSEERYRTLTEAAHDYICVFNDQLVFEFANSHIIQTLANFNIVVLNRSLKDVIEPDLFPKASAAIERLLKTGEPDYLETLHHAQNKEIWLGTNLAPIFDQNGKISAVLAVARDITVRKQIEEEMQIAYRKEKELNEVKSYILRVNSHEFRTPVSTILSSAELMEIYSESWPAEKRLQHLQRIRVAAMMMKEMLAELQAIEQFDELYGEISLKQVDVAELCRRSITENLLLDRNQHTIYFRADPPMLPADVDEKIFIRMVNNLLQNALKYSPVSSPIRLDLDLENEWMVMKVQDEGIGIPEADLSKVIEPFQRGSNVGDVQGTGFGLTIVQKSVELMHGQFLMESTEGIGTTIVVRLPLRLRPV